MVFPNENNPSENPNSSKPSDADNKPEVKPTPDESNFPTVAKYAKRRRQKKIALAVLSVGSAGIAIFVILSFLGDTSGKFTIRMNEQMAMSGIKMTEKIDGPESSYLLAEGLKAANLDTAEDVLTYVDALPVEGLGGSNNKPKGGSSESGIETALVYTFYLHNTLEEEANFMMSLNLDGYSAPTNDAVQPYSYIRVALYETEAMAGLYSNFDVYALRNSRGWHTPKSEDDRRECLSTYSLIGNEATATYDYDGSHGYCNDFVTNNIMFERTSKMAGFSVNRYTVVIWAEGNDYDCKGQPPEGTSLTFTLNMNSI
ncbi:MAG: hypothetical protein MJ239_05870 [Bacilli bacterium]|nr:hypothetical protein [Bacilli bacterium]